jgi:hypothetical protein
LCGNRNRHRLIFGNAYVKFTLSRKSRDFDRDVTFTRVLAVTRKWNVADVYLYLLYNMRSKQGDLLIIVHFSWVCFKLFFKAKEITKIALASKLYDVLQWLKIRTRADRCKHWNSDCRNFISGWLNRIHEDICLRIVVSNTYCVVFLLSFSSSCIPYFTSFFGLSIFDCAIGILKRLFSIFLGERSILKKK